MSLSSKQIDILFDNIKTGSAALFLGQKYICNDKEFYGSILKKIGNYKNDISFNSIWNAHFDELDKLGNAISQSAENASFKPWLRALFDMGWNVIISSAVNGKWMQNSLGECVTLTFRTVEELQDNHYKLFGKKKLSFIHMFGDENSLPNKRELRKLQNQTKLINAVYSQILEYYGYFIIDGIADDDWFDIKRLLCNLDDIPKNLIYIFDMTLEKLSSMCSDDDFEQFNEYINEGSIILCESSLKDIIETSGRADDVADISEFDHENEVRVNLSEDECIWISRNDCSELKSLGITIMRDELLTPLYLDDENKTKYFLEFLEQRDQKNWGFFDIIYKKERCSFHVDRHVEGLLEDAVTKQLNSVEVSNNIVLLQGVSNSGKTVSLSYLAWKAAKYMLKKVKKNNNYVVIFINGDPLLRDKEWKKILINFIKNSIKSTMTNKGNRIKKILVIWDNYSSQNKKKDYVELYKSLIECNVVLVGSVYKFEVATAKASIIQDISFDKLMPLKPELEIEATNKLNNILNMINPEYSEELSKISSDNYIFDKIIKFAEYKFSEKWSIVSDTLKAKLQFEVDRSENLANTEFKLFIENNADCFTKVQNEVFRFGIGSLVQKAYLDLDDVEKKQRNEGFYNMIKEMNCILAVIGQFNSCVKLPFELLIKTISDGKRYSGVHNKLKRILKSDSMAEYTFESNTGRAVVSFRHPSEALAYLELNYGKDNNNSDRLKKEVDVVMRLIDNCDWDDIEQAKTISAVVRCFGTNSYGKFNDSNVKPGNYDKYSEYWIEIADRLRSCAHDNGEAILIASHFTRDHYSYKMNETEKGIMLLDEVFKLMDDYINKPEYVSVSNDNTKMRLYGEMCRNILQRIMYTSNDPMIMKELSRNFDHCFEQALEILTDPNKHKNIISNSNIQLLDIWLNYFRTHSDREKKLMLADALEYIDLLFYNESLIIDDEGDYTNLIDNIDEVYCMIRERDINELKDIFANTNNDSFIYCLVQRELLSVYDEFKIKYPNLFGNGKGGKSDEKILSGRIFFLNENAQDDFRYEIEGIDDVKKIFNEIKSKLQIASKKIIDLLDSEYKNIRDMSYRCLLIYLRVKWMYYTGNLMLETEQVYNSDADKGAVGKALTDVQWDEIHKICSAATTNALQNNNFKPNRAIKFIDNIYFFIYDYKKADFKRNRYEKPNRLVCLCDPVTNKPRIFMISTRPDINSNKVYAVIDYEIINGEKKKTDITGRKGIYVPESIKGYMHLKKGVTNIRSHYTLWFNLGGAQIKDANEEVSS